ncbi:MAG: EAL domain-containing protein [Methylococcales bacterium]|nr:EAL domain-containing protein [Methylococcales bacterium]
MTNTSSELTHNDKNFCVTSSLHTITLDQLLNYVEPVSIHERSLDILNRFIKNEHLTAVAIVDAQLTPVGLMDRSRITEIFSKPFAKDLLYKQRITELMDAQSIVLDVHTSVDDAANIIIDADMRHMVTGFIVVKNGIYAGIVSGHALLEAITLRKQHELYFLAHYDQLTRIPNRTLFKDRLHMACLNSNRNNKMSALIFIDLDRFKLINDSLGHGYGDQLLITIAHRLTDCVRESDTVARLGGDEFVIILQNMVTEAHVEHIAKVIMEKIQEPMLLFEQETHVTASLGIALYPQHATSSEDLIRKADIAMYHVKKQTRNNYLIYSDVLERDRDERLVLNNALNKALERNEFSLFYQPQIQLEENRLVGVEALIRWHHPELGMVSPAKFIPLAEETGLIIKIGEWVLREACKQHVRWVSQGLPPLRIAVNISAKHFHQTDFCHFVQLTLADAGIDPRFIELELTESMMMINVEHAIDTMNKLRALGFKLAIDDFGTGYSSLSYLRRFPIDRIKIDQSFVRNISTIPANEAIVRAIMALGHNLGLEMIAEGIETIEELNCIRSHNCLEAQGYYFLKPAPANELESWLHLFDLSTPKLTEQKDRLLCA